MRVSGRTVTLIFEAHLGDVAPQSAASRGTVPFERDEQWRDAGTIMAERMGYEEHPWVMVRHGEDHVHIVVSRVSDTGQVWHARQDFRAAQSAATATEKHFGLIQAPRQKSTRTGPEQPENDHREPATHRGAADRATGQEPRGSPQNATAHDTELSHPTATRERIQDIRHRPLCRHESFGQGASARARVRAPARWFQSGPQAGS
jgi:hypothetical protein